MNVKKILTKFNVILVVAGLSAGCSDKVYEQQSDKYPFEKKMKSILGENLEIINSLRKAEVQISNVKLSKDLDKMNRVVNLLEKDGWVFKGKGIGVDTYCLGKNNSINIVIPTSYNVTDFMGDSINISDYNLNVISYSYNKWGDDLCE